MIGSSHLLHLSSNKNIFSAIVTSYTTRIPPHYTNVFKQVTDSLCPIIVVGPHTNNKSGIAIDESMNVYFPVNLY